MNQVVRVRECGACGEVCDFMATLCPRCQRYGTFQERYQCSKCGRILEDKNCWACAAPAAIREGDPVSSAPAGDLAERPVPNLVDPYAVPPWAAGGVGGAIVGAGVGAVAALFLSESPVVGALIGVIPGAALGALLTGKSSQRR